jgi:hypothetical protein
MISQVSPEEFGSAYQNGKARVRFTLTLPAETLANIRAVSYAIGGLSVEQLIEGSLRVFMYMGPQDIIANQEDAWIWDEPDEQARLAEAKAIARACEGSWPAFRAEVADLRPFWGG